MSRFGDRMKKLRKEKALTLEVVAKRIGSHKGYVSGIENGKVNPPSVKIIKKFAKLFGQNVRMLVRLAWVDKAPEIIREDAERFLEWCQREERPSGTKASTPAEVPPVSVTPHQAGLPPGPSHLLMND